MRSPQTVFALSTLWLTLFCVAVFCTITQFSCGSGHSDAGAAKNSAGSGRATFSVHWPEQTRLIPNAANSIVVRLYRDGSQIAARTLERPATAGTTTAQFESLAVGDVTATATAYPETNGTGTAQATAAAPLHIVDNQTATLTLTMSSTITRVAVTAPTAPLAAGDTTLLVATAYDKDDQVVLLSPATLAWTSSDTATVTVDSAGTITAVAPGSAQVTAKETESNQSGSVTLSVNAASPSPSPSGSPGDVAPQFAPGIPHVLASAIDQVVAGDFDGDNKADVAVGNSDGLQILYGRGDGTLEDAVTIDTNPHFGVRCAADVNNDGRLDLLAGDGDNTYLFLNNGGRSFATAITCATGPSFNMAAGQAGSSGNKLIAVVVRYPDLFGYVAILRLEGGSLQQIGTYSTPSTPLGVAMADLNGDGKADIAATFLTSIINQSGVITLFSNGDGTFTHGARYDTGTENIPSAEIADLNNDGKPDIAVDDYWDFNLAVLLNTGAGAMTTPSRYPANVYPHFVKAADFDGDGWRDLATANAGSDKMTVLWNRGGTFADGVTFPVNGENCRSLDIADFNNDGKPDIVVQCENTKSVCVLLNTTP